jgi:hypothetical protein
MNTSFFRFSAFAAAAGVAVAATSFPAGAYDHKIGGGLFKATLNSDGSVDRNWFNPANWSTGLVPGAEDDVYLDGNDHVVIDAAANRAGTDVRFRDLHVRDAAVFEAKNGAVVRNRYETVLDRGQVNYRGSVNVGEGAVYGASSDPTASAPSVSEIVVTKLNPTAQNKRTIVLMSSATLDLGLGGTTAAGGDVNGDGREDIIVGAGTYSTLETDALVIEGELRLSLHYGFQPRPGNMFQIVTVNGMRSGEFMGVPEGGYVGCTDRSTCLRLSYQGGDGNDIVLSAEEVSPETALLIGLLVPAVQTIADASKETAQTREHILLARQVGVPPVEATATKLPAPTTPISSPPPPNK